MDKTAGTLQGSLGDQVGPDIYGMVEAIEKKIQFKVLNKEEMSITFRTSKRPMIFLNLDTFDIEAV